jgi:diamine N-acetyltransferase
MEVNMKVRILPVSTGELEHCAEVIRESFLTVADDFGLTIENCPTNGAFIKTERLAADVGKGNSMYGLYEDDNMTGFMQLEYKGDRGVILEKLAVLPSYRHKGYGKILLDFAKKEAKRMGGAKLLAAIIEENAVLKSWYLENGFEHTGTKVFPHLPFTVGFLEAVI